MKFIVYIPKQDENQAHDERENNLSSFLKHFELEFLRPAIDFHKDTFVVVLSQEYHLMNIQLKALSSWADFHFYEWKVAHLDNELFS